MEIYIDDGGLVNSRSDEFANDSFLPSRSVRISIQTSSTHHTEPQSPAPDHAAQRLPVLNLTAQHHAGQLVGGQVDEPALQQLSRGLYRSTRHVLVVGDRGVGKTTLLHELARQAALGELSHLSTARLLYVDGRQIPGGDGAAF